MDIQSNGRVWVASGAELLFREHCVEARRGAVSQAAALGLRRSVMEAVTRLPEAAVVRDNEGRWRTAFGVHLVSDALEAFALKVLPVTIPDLLTPDDWYLYQTKVTVSRSGARGFPWHQDYWKWRWRDAVPEPGLLSVAVALSEVSLLASPLAFVLGSHSQGLIASPAWWLPGSTARSSGDDVVVVPLSPGDVVAFGALVTHGSWSNLDAADRILLFCTYNRTLNAPPVGRSSRFFAETERAKVPR